VAERLLVVGGDAAGMSAAAIARRRDPDLEIVAFEKGPYTSYSACGIPYFVGGLFDDSDRLITRSPEEFRAGGIDARTRHEVTSIDLDRREATVVDLDAREERTEGFDQLVYATGAEAVIPDLPGAQGVEPVLKVDAAERFRTELRHSDAHHAVVVGASYLGLEMAEALVSRGMDVTLIDQMDQVFGTLDPDMAAHVQDAAEAVGINVMLSTELEEVKLGDDDRPTAVVTSEGEIAAEHVVMSTGVRPATAIAIDAGLETVGEAEPGAPLEVDDHQRCPGHDGVFAAGDCVASWHRILERPVNVQLGTHANKQGRIAGVNATGGDTAFPGVIGTAVSRICRYEVARTGISEREAEEAGIEVEATIIKDQTRAKYYPGSGPIWVKLVCEPGSGRILGGQIVGVEGAAKRIDVLATCVWTGVRAQDLELFDLSYAPPFSGVYDPLLVAARQAAKTLDRERAG
jgi:NADPH-dependent 2,4-dienoyl-CoA reductase/sulfur reductase-like enzyme